jgi:hypothetical protein
MAPLASFEFNISRKPWIRNPVLRWDAGLQRAGIAWRNTLASYPPRESGCYSRTGTLRDKANFSITEVGREMNLLGVFYTRYALWGTGIYGPSGTAILPKKGKYLWFPCGDKLIRARQSSGYIWEGKLEEAATAMKDELKKGIGEYDEGELEE